MDQVVITCRHIQRKNIQPIPGQPITTVSCLKCYQPKHERTPRYYRVRTAVRFLFWTAVVTVSSAVGIAAIWILWAVS